MRADGSFWCRATGGLGRSGATSRAVIDAGADAVEWYPVLDPIMDGDQEASQRALDPGAMPIGVIDARRRGCAKSR